MKSLTLFKIIILVVIISILFLSFRCENFDINQNENTQTATKKKSVTFDNSKYTSSNSQMNLNAEETPAFSKYQEYGLENSYEDYYCGGASTAMLKGMQIENTGVSLVFFSDDNIKRLQKKIKSRILRETNGKFKLDVNQDVQDLVIVMRAVFLDKAKNIDTHIVRQVKILNQQTLDYIIPDMITNLKQQYGYLKDITEPRKIMPLPLNVNKTQRGNLPSFTTLWK